MVDKRKGKSLGELTAYERWELPNISADGTMEAKVSERVEKVKPLTADDIETIRQQAYKDGFEEGRLAGLDSGMQEGKAAGHQEGVEMGRQAGHEQGLQQAQIEINALKNQLTGLIAQIHSPLESQSDLVNDVLLNVVVALSRSVINKELSLQKDVIKKALNSVIESLPDFDSGAVLSVNSHDLPIVQELLESQNKAFDIAVDDSLVVGGFKIKTTSQLIDYTIEKRFQKAVQNMLSQSLGGDSGEQEIPSSIGALSDYSPDTLNEDGVDHGSVSTDDVVEESANSDAEKYEASGIDSDNADIDSSKE